MTNASVRLKNALAGRYSIERELGSGGMVTVYLAQDLKHGCRVAIKVLRPELAATLRAYERPANGALARHLRSRYMVRRRSVG